MLTASHPLCARRHCGCCGHPPPNRPCSVPACMQRFPHTPGESDAPNPPTSGINQSMAHAAHTKTCITQGLITHTMSIRLYMVMCVPVN